MATISKQAQQSVKAETSHNATADVYNDMPTWSVGTTTDSPKARVSHTLGKWAKLFTIDETGDANLMNLFVSLHESMEDHGDTDRLMKATELFVLQFLGWREEHLGSNDDLFEDGDEISPSTNEEEQEPQREMTPLEHIMASKGLRSLTRLESIPDVIQTAIAVDFESANMTWQEYAQSMEDYTGNLWEYLADSWYPAEDGQAVQRTRSISCVKAAKMWEELASSPQEAPAQEEEEVISPEVRANLHKNLANQCPHYRNATAELREQLLTDCYTMMKQGQTFVAWRDALRKAASGEAFLGQ